jgi:hypothetical protein
MAIAELAPKDVPAPAQLAQTPITWLPTLRHWTIAFLFLGVGWRLLRYLLQFPIWGDEAYMCLNFMEQTYFGLVGGLKHAVVAPLLFLWGELAVYQCLGGSDLAVRLLPVLAGLAALPVFWKLARQVLEPTAAVLAFGILAVAYYPVRHAVEVRPYSFDLLVSVALLSVAFAWLQEPKRLNLLVFLCLLLPVVLGVSNPVVFVAGGISIALLPTVWREPARAKALWVIYNIVLVTTFLIYLQINMAMQPASALQFLDSHWGHAFPPGEPIAFLKWLIVTHTSNMMAYPAGGKNGTSALTFLLFLAGIWQFARACRWDVLLLCLAPFALTFIAACLHRYPYGDSARFCQHLAPATCILVAAGIVSLISSTCRTVRSRQLATAAACGALVIVGGAGIARDLLQPYKTSGDQECRRMVAAIVAQAGPDCPIVVLSAWDHCQPEWRWYLLQNHARLYRHEQANWEDVVRGGRVLCLRASCPEPPGPPVELAPPWRLVDRAVFTRPLAYKDDITETIEVFEFRID